MIMSVVLIRKNGYKKLIELLLFIIIRIRVELLLINVKIVKVYGFKII